MDIINKVKEIIERTQYIDERDGEDYIWHCFVDYDEEISDRTIAKIMQSEHPREALNEEIWEWEVNYQDYAYPELIKEIEHNLEDEEWEEHEEEIKDWVTEHCHWYYNFDDLDREIEVDIMIDSGDANYDFTCNNVLNWDGRYSNGEFEKESSMLWLAKTQRKATKLRKACKAVFRNDVYYVDREKQEDKFIESMIQELENACSHMNTLTFLVTMKISEIIDLQERINSNENGYLVIDKRTMCGLYNEWNGSGSLLEIELDKDVKVPFSMIHKAVPDCALDHRGSEYYNWSIQEVYGMCKSAWKYEVKEICA